MSIAHTSAKVAAVVAGLGLVFASVAPLASAQTTTTTTSSSSSMSAAQLQAQIAALLAQIQSLQAQLGTSSTGTAMFTTDLTIGSTGASVTSLQSWLIAKGYSIPAGATGYFGAQTQAALASFQAANGITPAAGYFGPITRAKVNAMAGSTTTTTTTTGGTTTTTTGTLSGGEGSIDNFKIVGATNTSLNASDSDTVYGFEFKAGGSDLAINRVDYDIYKSAGSGSVRPSNVFQTAELWDGSTRIASMDISGSDSLSQDGTASNGNQIYRIRFDGLSDVVKEGSTADFYLKLYTQSGISDTNSGGTYTVMLTPQGVRATDAMGIQQYSSASTQTAATIIVSNNTTGSLTLSTGSDNPQTTTVMGNTNSNTTGIVLNTFSLQAKDADLDVFTIPVQVSTTTSNATNQIRSLKLYQGSTLLDTESVPAANISGAPSVATTTFTNLNIHIPEGSTQNFSVQADINQIDGANFKEGSSVQVSVPNYGFDAENGSGDSVTVNGSSSGNVITFRSIGFSADSSPAVASATSNNNGANSASQTGTFTFTFNVTAFGQDVYLATTSAKAFVGGVFQANGSAATTTTSSAITSTADRTSDGTNNYVVHNGQTKQVTVTFADDNTNGLTQFYYARLNTLYFATTTLGLWSPGANGAISLPATYQTNQVLLHT